MNAKEKRERLLQMLAVLAEVYEKDFSPAALNLYWLALQEYEWEQIESGLKGIIKTHMYPTFPTPAEIIRCIEPPECVSLKALEGWRSLNCAIELCGTYGSPTFRDPVVARTIAYLGGWIELCYKSRGMSDTDWDWLRREFVRIYQTVATHGGDTPPPQLLGLHDRENGTAPQLPQPKPIGEIMEKPDEAQAES